MAQPPSLDLRSTGTLRPGQRQSLRAGLRQGMALLSLPAVDLHAELTRQAADNPFLVVDRPIAGNPGPHGAPAADDLDTLGHIAAPPSLTDHLHTQIACMDLAPRIRALALYFAADLDPRGLLPGTDEEIAGELGVAIEDVGAARAALHACEPAGLGAPTVGACVALQLVERGVDPHLARAAIGSLADIADGRIAAAARALNLTTDAVRALADQIRTCTPDPAAQFSAVEIRPLIPEIAIERTRLGGLLLRLLDDPATTVSLDAGLIASAGQSKNAGQGRFETSRQSAARRLVAALNFRSRTLIRVGEALLEAQSAFLMGHRRAPAPLQRAELAARLGLHPTTVGRAVKGRGLLFEGQVRPMGWYFPTGIAGAGNTFSQPEILALVRDLVAAETAETVLSDEALADRLREDGVDIARRTVAKYRQCLHIPSSSRRRRLLAHRAMSGHRGRRTT